MVKNTTIRSGVALRPTAYAVAASGQGPEIKDPHKEGDTLQFVLTGAANAGVTVLTIGVEGKKADGNWEDVLDTSGNAITFAAADTIATGDLSANGKALLGTLAIDRLPYESYRLDVRTVIGGTATIAAIYNILDIRNTRYEDAPKDHFLFKTEGFTAHTSLNGTANR